MSGCISATRSISDELATAGALAGVDLLYPDPWPKKRHWKRRFVQDATVAELARIYPSGRSFSLRDGHSPLCCVDARKAAAPDTFEWTAEKADDWRLPWPEWIETRYEAKHGAKGGRGPILFSGVSISRILLSLRCPTVTTRLA